MSPRKVDKEAKRKMLFNTAMELFTTKGYDYTTMDDIAEAADVGKGTIYEYYSSKTDFIKEAYHHYITPNDGILEIYYNTNYSPIEKIKILLVKLIEEFLNEQKISKVILNIWLEGSSKKIYPKINLKKVYSQTRQMMDSLLEEAKVQGQVRSDIPKYTSSIILGMFEGLTLQLMADPKLAKPEDLGEAIADVIINGIKK